MTDNMLFGYVSLDQLSVVFDSPKNQGHLNIRTSFHTKSFCLLSEESSRDWYGRITRAQSAKHVKRESIVCEELYWNHNLCAFRKFVKVNEDIRQPLVFRYFSRTYQPHSVVKPRNSAQFAHLRLAFTSSDPYSSPFTQNCHHTCAFVHAPASK